MSHIEWWVKYAPTEAGGKSEFHSHALAKEDYENLIVCEEEDITTRVWV